jgi:hypothetical protein
VKKVAVIILFLLYGSATMGATLHIHFCMNEAIGWSLVEKKDDKCGMCGMDEKDKEGCCKDERKHIKLTTDHAPTGFTLLAIAFSVDAHTYLVKCFDFSPFAEITYGQSPNYAPPDPGATSLHVIHGNFRV